MIPSFPTRLLRRTDGSSSSETLVLVLMVALAGASGFQVLGGSMGNAISGDAGSGKMALASMAGTGATVVVSGQAGTVPEYKDAQGNPLEFTPEALKKRGVSQEDLEMLEAIGVDIEHLADAVREDLEARGVDPDLIDDIYGPDPGTIKPTIPQGTGNGSGNGNNTGTTIPNAPTGEPNKTTTLPTEPTLLDGKQTKGSLDPSEVDADGLLQGTGETLTIDEIDPNGARFKDCTNMADLEARWACMAKEANVKQPKSYEPGGKGCFGSDWGGTCMKDLWHKFAGGFEKEMGGIVDFFKGAIKNPGDTLKGFVGSILHIDKTVKATGAHYKELCVDDGALSCAGAVAANGVFALGTGVLGRVLAGGKTALVRRFPSLGEIPGLRMAGRRVEYGPFATEEFHDAFKAASNDAEISRLRTIGRRAKETLTVKKIMPSNSFMGRWRAAWDATGMAENEARLFAESVRRGRVTGLTGLNFDSDFIGLGVRNIDDLSPEVRLRLEKTLDGAVKNTGAAAGDNPLQRAAKSISRKGKGGYTAADSLLQRVANSDGTGILSNKVKSIKVEANGNIELTLKASPELKALAGTSKNKNLIMTVEEGGDAVRLTMPNKFKSPSWGLWKINPWIDGIGTGLPFAVGGVMTKEYQVYSFLEAVKKQQDAAAAAGAN